MEAQKSFENQIDCPAQHARAPVHSTSSQQLILCQKRRPTRSHHPSAMKKKT